MFDGFTAWPPGRRELDPLLVCAPRSARIARGPTTRVFRSDFGEDETLLLDGFRITSPTRTAFDIARLSTYENAVVALDRLRSLGLLDVEALMEMIDVRRYWTGNARARRAVRDSADRVESPRESMLRLMWLETGLGTPVTNPVIRTADGEFIARVDLLDLDTGIVGEYDGEYHASAARRSDDARRQELLYDVGLRMIRATSTDLGTTTARSAWQGRLRRLYANPHRDKQRRVSWIVSAT